MSALQIFNEAIKGGKGALSTVRNATRAADEALEAQRLAMEAANAPVKASEAYGKHEGAYLKPIFYDRMKVDLARNKLGGPGFSSIQLVDPNYAAAKAVAGVTDKKMGTRILNRNKANVPEGANVIWTPSVGSLEQHKSNSTMFGEFADIFVNQRKNMSNDEIQKLSDYASTKVDNKGKLIFPNGIDLGSRNFRQKVSTYNQRALMADIFAGRGVGGEAGRTVPVEELLQKNLDPNMANAGTLDLGNRLFKLEGNVIDRPDLHTDYPKILTGEDLNVNYLPVPIRTVYNDWEIQKALDLAAQGKNRPVTQMDYTKNDPTIQLTEELLTRLQKEGYAEGGEVHADFHDKLDSMIQAHMADGGGDFDSRLESMIKDHHADTQLKAMIDARFANAEGMAEGGAVDLSDSDSKLKAMIDARFNTEEPHMGVGGLLNKGIRIATKEAPQEKALLLAKQNAEKLGQSANPDTRMLQQGYEQGWYHGSTGDIKRFSPNLRGESTGAQSAKKGFFFARDPSTPPAHMVEHDPKSLKLLKELNLPIPPKPSMKGHGAETAGSYAGAGGSREYKEAMRKAKSAEKSGNWDEQEKYMTQAEDAVTDEMRYRQGLVAQHGDARDDMLEKVRNAWYGPQNAGRFKNMSQADYEAHDKLFNELMPYGWYTSPLYEKPQFKNLIDQISSVTGEKHAKEAADAINKYLSVRNERAAADVESGANVLPVALRYENPMYHDFEGKSYREQTYSDLMDEALRKGHDALILKNTFDPGGSGGNAKMVDVGVVFDPDQIRSRFAAFDPLRKTAATAAAAGLAAPDLLAEEKKKANGGLAHFAAGGSSRRKADVTEALTEGLAPMLYGGAKGALASLLGFSGELEQLGRTGLNFSFGPGGVNVGEEPFLPNTKRVSGALPNYRGSKVANEVAEMGTDLGENIVGTMLDPLAVIKGAKPALEALKRLRGSQGTPATRQAQRGVIKMPGGNWRNNSVENALKGLKSEDRLISPALFEGFEQSAKDPTDPLRERSIRRLQEHQNEIALNNYVDRNLTNYVKKQMATPDDPVRKLAEEGIVHIPTERVGMNRYKAPENRRMYGGEQMGKSEAAQAWEDASDVAIYPGTVGEIKRVKELGGPEADKYKPWMEKADPETIVSRTTGNFNAQDLGFDHIMDVLRQDVASGRIRPEQLNKVSMEQAVRRTAEYDRELAEKMNASRAAAREGLPVHKEYPEGYKWIELNKPGSFASESEAMGHSVRGYEPPKGHPDWVESSGDSGSSGYGHGGWEAIKSGKAKVYSLVNPKGEPHVTVEVGKADPSQTYIEKQPLEVQDEFKRRFDNWAYNIDYRPSPEEIRSHTQYLFDDMGISTPSRISQIKGKQNAAPKEDYLPYVQDFVKSGNWSDVGDFRNTGLIRKSDLIDKFSPDELDAIGAGEYLTKGEHDDLMLKALQPPKGMKRGGAACGCDLNAQYKRFKKGGSSCGCGGAFKTLQWSQRFAGGGIASPEEGYSPPADGEQTYAGLVAEYLAQAAKDQGGKELSSLNKPRAATDLLNRGVLANNPLSAIIDMVNMGLIPLDVLGSALAGRDIKVSSEKPFLGSEHLKDLMNKYNVTSGENRPMMETALSFASPTGMIKGAQKTVDLAKKTPEMVRKVESGFNEMRPAVQRPFTPATFPVEATAPDLGQGTSYGFRQGLNDRLLANLKLGTGKTKAREGQGTYVNTKGELELNPLQAIDVPMAGNIGEGPKANRALRQQVAQMGVDLNQEAMAGHRFLPMITNNIKDASAMLIKTKDGLSKDQIADLARVLGNDMVVSHNPKLGGVVVFPFGPVTKGQIPEEFLTAQSAANKVLGKDAKIQYGKSDFAKDRLFMDRSEYSSAGAIPMSAEQQALRGSLQGIEKFMFPASVSGIPGSVKASPIGGLQPWSRGVNYPTSVIGIGNGSKVEYQPVNFFTSEEGRRYPNYLEADQERAKMLDSWHRTLPAKAR